MNQLSFNLIDQPWIPCISLEGEYVELGLYDLFDRAHQLRALHCETPIMNAAILPVTLAILHRVFGPKDKREWRALWGQGRFPMAEIDTYFANWRDRFDLFHPERPFYQASDDRVKPRSIIHLIQSIANTGTLFTHEDEARGLRLSPAMAARHLVTAQAFRTAGLSGLDEKFTDGVYARGVLFWAQGNNLFETLVFNLFRYPDAQYFNWTPDDAPAWEQDDPFRVRKIPDGYLDYLTWQSNRILLQPEMMADGSPQIASMTIAPGLTLDSSVNCPQKRYVLKEKEGESKQSFLYFSEQRALWRDYHSLLPPSSDKELVKPPVVIDWLADIAGEGVEHAQLLATGMLADQAKPIFYRQESLPLPTALLSGDSEYRWSIADAIQRADDVADLLRRALSILADHVLMRGGDLKPDGKTRSNLMQQWDALGLYWATLEPAFWAFIDELVMGTPDADAGWYDVLKDSARGALDAAEVMAGSSPWALKGGVMARRNLNLNLNKLFEPQQEGV